MKVTICEYDADWPRLYEREATRIRGALGDDAEVAHVGSTSVPGLAAKPIIDILLLVPDSRDEPAYLPALESAGYVFGFREPDWFEHRMFKGPDTRIHLHVFSSGEPEAAHMLRFRDHLRVHDADRELYERTKRELAQRDWTVGQDYADAKTQVVQEILGRAKGS